MLRDAFTVPSETSVHEGVPLRIALLAPPWIPVPPPAYGGIESVVARLADGLVARGHDVTLFAAPGSRSSAQVVPVLEACHPDEIQRAIHEADHVARCFEALERAERFGGPFDVLHDHSGFTAFAMADRVTVPMLHTLHGPFDEETSAFYRRHAAKAWVSALSAVQRASAPPELRFAGVIPNPLDVDEWPFSAEKDDYLLWVGRMSPCKGPHRAIDVARRAGRRLILGGPVQPGQEAFFAEEIEPHVDGDAVRYVDEVGGREKHELFAQAAAFVMPIRWPEPFGMVMIEAMAAGTPVIAFPEGAAGEVVVDGENGFLVADEAEMARAVDRVGELDPARCRSSVAERYDVDVVAAAYEAAYRRIVADRLGSAEAPGAPLERREVTSHPA
ncbi:glycosyltransferase family 4 protein [Capillimicrobium parvum]|uniref:D-inositol-3-phosphate glycosyltransferase n=1 Tax=Capillimicrobium parvum TaxID=2884022 RepID=A0A9E6Y382_9ACTN|nr:glycosyltransferase family 4 protein [Capillimicrobium parvum]UGS38661.1 D-inositol-3-phosphate glycosyltransferase [Capillimicrobium parvum]